MSFKNLFLRCFFAIFSLGNIVFAAKLTIKFKNIKNDNGDILVLIWDDPDRYLKSPPAKQAMASLVGAKGEMEIVIDKLKKKQDYAILAYHDESKAYASGRNIVAVPTEGYVFGNNTAQKIGAPTFKEVSIVLENDHSFLEMTLTNHKTLNKGLEEDVL